MSNAKELSEILTSSLRDTAVLARMKGELRAELFNALRADTAAVERASMTDENIFINELIREYLLFNSYNHTESMLRCETKSGTESFDKQFMCDQLSVSNIPKMPVLYSLITKHLTKTSGYEHNTPAPSRSTKLPASPHSTDRYEQNNHHHHHEGHRSSTSPSRAKVGGPAPSKQYPIIRNGIMKNGTTSATSGPDKSRDTIPRSSTENATRSHLTVTSNRLAPAQTPPTDSGHRCQTQQRLQQQETVSTKQQAASRSSASGRERRSYDQDHDDDDDDLKSRKSTAATSYNNTSPSDTTTSRTSNRDAEHSRTSNRDVEHSRTSNSDASDRYRGSSNRDSAERSWTSSRDADRLRRSKDSRPESPFTAERNYIVEELAKLSNSDDVYDEESYIVTDV